MKKLFLALITVIIACLGLKAQDAENIFITGDATEKGWNLSHPEDMRVALQADGLYKWSGKLNADGRFRFITTSKWYPTYTTAASSHQPVSEGTYDITYDVNARSGEPSFRVTVSGEYTILLDLEAMTMNIHLDKKSEEAMHIYIVGSGCPAGWSTGGAIELQRLDNGHYTWTGDLTKENEGRFRFITTRNWWPSYTTANPEHTLVKAGQYALAYYETGPKGEPSFKVEVPGNYTVDLDIDNMIMTLTLNSAFEEKYMYIIGNATTGRDLAEGEQMPVVEMHLTGENLFEWTGDLYSETLSGERALFRFAPDSTGDITYTCRTDMAGDEEVSGGDSYDLFEKTAGEGHDNWFYPSAQSRYTIVVDTRLMTMSVMRHKSELYLVGGAVTGANAPWGFNDKYLSKMTETDTPLVFEWTGFLHANSADGKVAKFKFLTSSSAWAGFVNGAEDDTTVEFDSTYPLLDSTKPGSGDKQFMVPHNGLYHLVVDTRALTLTISDGTSGIITPAAENGVDMQLTGRTLTFSAIETAEVTVFDIAGRIVAATVASEGSTELPGAGIYVVRINDIITKIAVK